MTEKRETSHNTGVDMYVLSKIETLSGTSIQHNHQKLHKRFPIPLIEGLKYIQYERYEPLESKQLQSSTTTFTDSTIAMTGLCFLCFINFQQSSVLSNVLFFMFRFCRDLVIAVLLKKCSS